MTYSVIDALTVVDQLVASQLTRQAQPSSTAFRDGIIRNADAFHRTPTPAWALFSGLALVRYISRGADLNEQLTVHEQELVATFHRHITDLEDWTTPEVAEVVDRWRKSHGVGLDQVRNIPEQPSMAEFHSSR